YAKPDTLYSAPQRRANSLGFNTGTAIWPPAFSKPASEVTSGAWTASASAANLRSAGSGTNPNASGCVEPPNRSSERNRSAMRVHDNRGICRMTCSISAWVASSQAIRSRPSRTASTSRAEWLPGLNPAATNTLVSSTTLPGPVSITAVWRSGGSLRNTHSATAWHSRTRCACAGPRSHRRANAAGPAHAGSAYVLQHAAQPRPQPAVVKCGPRDPDIAPYGVGLP